MYLPSLNGSAVRVNFWFSDFAENLNPSLAMSTKGWIYGIINGTFGLKQRDIISQLLVLPFSLQSLWWKNILYQYIPSEGFLQCFNTSDQGLITAARNNDVQRIKNNLGHNYSLIQQNGLLHQAAQRNAIHSAKYLIPKTKINQRHRLRNRDEDGIMDFDEYGYNDKKTALHFASLFDALEVAELLLKNNATVDAQSTQTRAPLHSAARKNSLRVAKVLLRNSAKVDVRTIYGETPLHFAASRNYVEMAKLLIENNADVDAQDDYGSTPLHYAALKNSVEVAKLLIENNANVDAQDDSGSTPLFVAISNQNLEFSEFLHENNAQPLSEALIRRLSEF